MSSALLLVAVLACPIACIAMMVMMMRGHSKDGDETKHSDKLK